MALQKTLVRPGDLDLPGAFIKIVRCEVQSYGTSMAASIRVAWYKDKATADANGPAVRTDEFSVGGLESAGPDVAALIAGSTAAFEVALKAQAAVDEAHPLHGAVDFIEA